MAERKQKNDPGNYAADIWGTELAQTRQSTRTRRGKNGTIVIGGVSFTQDALFHGEEIRVPFPDAPVNKIPDRLGNTSPPGTLFSKPEQESQSTQTELLFIPQDAEDHTRIPLPLDPQVGKLPDDLKPFVTYIPLHLLSQEQRKQGIMPYVSTTFFIYRSERNGYVPGIMLADDEKQERKPLNYGVTKKDAKWRWGGYRQQWYNPSHFPDLPKEMYYANAGPAYYSQENAERLEARATKAREKSNTHYERSNQLAEVIPFGQPMMPDHYSYRSDLSYRKKIWKQMDLFVAFYKKADWLENRAEGSRRLQKRTTNISMMQNRLDRLQADLRLVRRNFQEAKQEGERDVDYYRKRLTILASEIVPLQEALAARGGLPIDKVETERPLQPGDLIQIRGRAMYVVKVNPKTLKVADPKVHDATGKMWELTYKKSDFQKILATKEELEARKNQ